MQKHTIEQLKWRKHILEERTDRENYNIIKKIDRNIARLAREKKHQGIGKSIKIDFNDWVEYTNPDFAGLGIIPTGTLSFKYGVNQPTFDIIMKKEN